MHAAFEDCLKIHALDHFMLHVAVDPPLTSGTIIIQKSTTCVFQPCKCVIYKILSFSDCQETTKSYNKKQLQHSSWALTKLTAFKDI